MATGVMTIKYNSAAIRNAANKAAGSFQDAAERVRGVAQRLDGMPENSSRRYIRNASAFLRKKEDQYEKKQAALEAFASRAETFMEDARSADDRVADHLEQSLKSFKKITGLGGSVISTILKNIADGLKYLATMALAGVMQMVKKFHQMQEKITEWVKATLAKAWQWVKNVAIRVWNLAVSFVKVAMTAAVLIGTAMALPALIAAGGVAGIALSIIAIAGIAGTAHQLFIEGIEMTGDALALIYEVFGQSDAASYVGDRSGNEMYAACLVNCGWDTEYSELVKQLDATYSVAGVLSAFGNIASFGAEILKLPSRNLDTIWNFFKSTTVGNINPAAMYNNFMKELSTFSNLKGWELVQAIGSLKIDDALKIGDLVTNAVGAAQNIFSGNVETGFIDIMKWVFDKEASGFGGVIGKTICELNPALENL